MEYAAAFRTVLWSSGHTYSVLILFPAPLVLADVVLAGRDPEGALTVLLAALPLSFVSVSVLVSVHASACRRN